MSKLKVYLNMIIAKVTIISKICIIYRLLKKRKPEK